MLSGKKTYTTAAGQLIFGIIGVLCFLKPDLVSMASSFGLTVLSPDQALLALAIGVQQLLAGVKSLFSRMAIAKLEAKK